MICQLALYKVIKKHYEEIFECTNLSLFLFQLWYQRSRLSSVRTLPERSNLTGHAQATEVHEEDFMAGSLHRLRLGSERGNPFISINRHRKLSTASSPGSFKVWTTDAGEEVDHNGYVLPGSPEQPEKGK